MVCPRCQSIKFEEGIDSLQRCLRCGALVAVSAGEAPARAPIVRRPLPEISFCET